MEDLRLFVPFIYYICIIFYIILFFFIISSLLNLARRGGVEVAGWFIGSEDPGSIPGIPSPRVKTSSDVPVSVPEYGKDPSCQWRCVPGSMSYFGNWTVVTKLVNS